MSDERLDEAKRRFGTTDALLSLAESLGAEGRGRKRSCPLCSNRATFAVFEKDGTALFRCHHSSCGKAGDAITLIREAKGLDMAGALDWLIGAEIRPPRRKQESARSTDGARAWGELDDDDAAGVAYLRSRGVDAAVRLGLVRFNTGRSTDSYVAWLGREGWRVAVPLRDGSGEVRSFQCRHVGTPPSGKEDGKPLPAKMSLRGTQPRAWFGTPHMAPAAEIVHVTEGMFDTLAVQIGTNGGCVIGVPGIQSLLGVVPQLGVMEGRTFVLHPQNDAKGQSQGAFRALAEEIRSHGGRVQVMVHGDAVKDPAEALQKGGLERFREGLSFLTQRHEELTRSRKPATFQGEQDAAPPPPPAPPGVKVDEGEALEAFTPPAFTDMGNAVRLVKRHGGDLHHLHAWETWTIWDGHRWQEDKAGQIIERMKDTVRHIPDEVYLVQDGDVKEEVQEWAVDSQSNGKIKAAIDLARSEPGIPASPVDFDANPWLMNVANGTLDLLGRCIREPRREDMLSKVTGVQYDPAADCPQWRQFMHEVFAGRQELIDFMQRATGYALTGSTREHCLFILYGDGRNGKGTYRDVIRALLGDYAHEADFSTFEATKGDAAGQPREDIVALMGKRFVAAAEANEGKRLDEGLVKRLTGEDAVRARRLHENSVEFVPIAKYFLLVNHKPVIKGRDRGIWARMRLIPFEVSFEGREDRTLKDRLLGELPGILNWALDGFADWYENGLRTPPEVLAATEEYREEMDIVGQWWSEHVAEAAQSTRFWSRAEIYDSYEQWCAKNKIRAKTMIPFGREFAPRARAAGFTESSNSSGTVKGWVGLHLTTPARGGGTWSKD